MSMAMIEAQKAAYLEELREEYADLLVKVTQAEEDCRKHHSGNPQSRVVQAATAMQSSATLAAHLLKAQARAGHRTAGGERSFRGDQGIERDLKQPNPMLTTALVAVGWTLETLFTATSLIADGKADPIEGLGFGATFSTANVLLGLGGGFVGRYITFRKQSRTPKSDDRTIRGLAIGGLAAFIVAHLVMVFTGGRTRVLGSHEGIFDFSEVSFAATFDDGLALIIMVSAVISFLIAWVKGYSGIADPIPGYADHVGKSGQDIIEAAHEIVEDALEDVDEIAERAAEDLDELTANPEDLEALREDAAAFNARRESSKDKIRVLALQEWEKRCLIEGRVVPRPRVDLSAFDALKIDLEQIGSPNAQPELTDALRAAQSEASAIIQAAFAAFSAAVHRGVVMPPLSDNET